MVVKSKRGNAHTSECKILCFGSITHFVCLIAHVKEVPLRKSSQRGLDMALKFGINFLNQFNSSKNSSFADVRMG